MIFNMTIKKEVIKVAIKTWRIKLAAPGARIV
jgi:hypothetical protein